jgi:hypothetical protein
MIHGAKSRSLIMNNGSRPKQNTVLRRGNIEPRSKRSSPNQPLLLCAPRSQRPKSCMGMGPWAWVPCPKFRLGYSDTSDSQSILRPRSTWIDLRTAPWKRARRHLAYVESDPQVYNPSSESESESLLRALREVSLSVESSVSLPYPRQ